MTIISLSKITYGQFGNAVLLSNGSVELVATLDFGPRVIRCGFTGSENLFFEDTHDRIVNDDIEAFAKVGGGMWHIYGGHRLWTSPEQVPRTTYPDNEPVTFREVENGVVLTPPEEKWNQLQKEIELHMHPTTGVVTVTHRVTNTGAWTVQLAPWALSVMSAGGKAIIPQTTKQTGLLPNRILTLWPYSKMNDKRVYWGERFITLKQDQTMPPFKFGYTNEEGWAAYYKNAQLFVKQYQHVVEGTYPDYGVSFETYTNEHMLELETLGQLQHVKPGQTVHHIETWSLHENVSLSFESEDELERGIASYVRQ